jgi:hypothetical protein
VKANVVHKLNELAPYHEWEDVRQWVEREFAHVVRFFAARRFRMYSRMWPRW